MRTSYQAWITSLANWAAVELGGKSRLARAKGWRIRKPAVVEALEERRLLSATITVTSNFDAATQTGQTTLIGAILMADNTSGGATIVLPADAT